MNSDEHTFDTILRFAKIGALLFLVGVVGGGVLVFVRETRDLLRATTITVASSDALVLEATQRLKDTSQNTNAVLIQLGLAADRWRRASESQDSYNQRLRRILDQTERTLTQLADTIEHTDRSLNEVLISNASVAIKSTNDTAQATTKAIQDIQTELKPVLEHAAITLQNAGQVLGDPSIKTTLSNLAQASEEIATASKNTVAITANVDKTTAHIEQAVARSTRPVHWVVKIATTTLSGMGAIGSFFQGMFK